jgi:hypothetical protein
MNNYIVASAVKELGGDCANAPCRAGNQDRFAI